ncbi:hypothetical protein C8E87_2234 [Paractinoplanes brasiliensis]|uniref:Uncharacterized protein n=1 Tax=Paractinoplanes brasiliensis TaxID=52695 RepID=A0A4R6JU45_9ACTN|nr:hypothetical protein C8E87_2234 [Actinoplanes brasiliensis]
MTAVGSVAAGGVPTTAAFPRARPTGPISGSTGGSYRSHRRTLNAVHSSGRASIAASPYPGRLTSKPSCASSRGHTPAYPSGEISAHTETPR